MSVIGVDVGYQTSVFAAPRGGGIEVLLNDYSGRKTSSLVSYGEKQRDLGEGAKLKRVTNFKNTIESFKPLIARKYADPDVQARLAEANYRHTATADGQVGVVVKFDGEDHTYAPRQVTASLLGHLRDCCSAALETKVQDCVVGVPVYFNDEQRHAMLDACKVAGLNCLRLFNETAAVALAYGIYKQDLPAAGEKPRRVVFVDVGHSGMQLSCAEFVKGKLSVLATGHELVGGRDFDLAIRDEMARLFKEKTGLDVLSKARSKIRLEQESEKLKKLMSANQTRIPMNIECLMEERDLQSGMLREDFETLCAPQFGRIEAALQAFVAVLAAKEVNVDSADDLYAVEIVGGATRIPKIKDLIKAAFKRESLSTTLNCDEAVARGCALMAAMASPSFHVREFKVQDATTYGIDLSWQKADSEDESNEELFPKHNLSHLAKMLSFYRDSDFELAANYKEPATVVGGQQLIGNYKVSGVRAGADGKAQKVKVKVRLNEHGCFEVYSASMVEKVAAEEEEAAAAPAPAEAAAEAAAAPEAMDTTPDSPADEAGAGGEAEKKAADAAADAAAAAAAAAPPKKTHVSTPLEVSPSKAYVLSGVALNELVEVELSLCTRDRVEKDKADAKNALEEYMYDIREKLGSSLEPFIKPADLDAFRATLNDLEDWLYDDGEDQPKNVYNEKLDALKTTGNAVKERAVEAKTRPAAIDSLRSAFVKYRKVLDEAATKYEHLDAEDLDKIKAQVEKHEAWINEKESKQEAAAKYDNVVVKTSEITATLGAMAAICDPIVNKPKPKPPPPAEPEKTADKEGAQEKEGADVPPANADAAPAAAEGDAKKMDMDLD